VSTGRVIRRFSGHAARVNGVAFNAESTVIVTGSYDATVKVWDCRSQDQAPIQTLKEAKDSVTAVQVCDHRILCSSVDGCYRMYE
jgi:mitogen-activated protein kinase organizer 1